MSYTILSDHKSPRRPSRRSLLCWGAGVAGAFALLLLLLERSGGAVSSRFGAGDDAVDVVDVDGSPISAPAIPPPTRKRAYIRAASLGTEGFGSIFMHFKHSIVFSSALDSNLILSWNEVDDDPNIYSTSLIYNARVAPADLTAIDARKMCRIQDYLPHGEREPLVRALCNGEDWAAGKMDVIRRKMDGCTSILDLENDELIQDMNGCVTQWIRDRLTPDALVAPLPPAITSPPTRPVTVGVHIRWGDTAVKASDPFDGATHEFYGSMSLPHIARVIGDLRAQYAEHGIQLTIAMERADPRVLDWLAEAAGVVPGEYNLLDSTDVLGDLQRLSASDVLMLGESSYGVLAHLIAPGRGLTLVEGGGYGKFSNTSAWGRHIVYMGDYTRESLQLLEQPL
ncbi:hypothetical protein MKEN_00507200 [Mycena kentingensis (nom. inval.)]|nr:hypothetical protein MKEN_00507200 [Mycena kentingensis (nom. inval.)]